MRNSVGSTFSKRLVFESLEPRLLLSADPLGAAEALAASTILAYDAPINGSADSYRLRFDAGSGDLQLLDGTAVVASRALAETSAVVIRGEDGHDDALTVDFSFGGFFTLAGGISFDGGADGIDLLSVIGGDFVTATHTATADGPGRSGSLVYDDGAQPILAIDYANLEPIDLSGSGITSLVLNLPGTDDQAILEDDGVAANGISQIRSQNANPTFETTLFSNSVTSLTVNMGGDNGSFTVGALPDFINKSLTIDGQAGADNVSFEADAAFGALIVTVGGSVSASSLALAGSSFIAAGTFSAASLSATAGTVTMNAETSAGALTISGGAAVNLNATASIGSLSVAGAGATGNTGGLGGGGDVTLLAGGRHIWNSGVLSGAGMLRVEQGATLAVSGGNHFLTSKPIVNDGRVHWDGGSIDINGTIVFANRGELELAAGSSFGNIVGANSTMQLTNTGRIVQQEAETTAFVAGVTLINSAAGLIDLRAGTLSIAGTFTQAGTVEVAEGAVLRRNGGFTSSGRLSGGGTIDVGTGSVINTGTVAPGTRSGDTTGTLSIAGNYTQATTGRLEIEVASTAAGDFDALAVNGAATITGNATLRVQLAEGAELQSGDRVRFMGFASRGGFFGVTDLPPGVVIDEADPTGLDLVSVNAAPQAADDAFTTQEDTPLTVAAPGVLGNDTDGNQDPLSVILISGPANGVLRLNADGSFTYVPDADFFGADSFTYQASDGELDSGVATVFLTVTAVNDAPVANADVFGVGEDALLEGESVLGNDTDADNDVLAAVLVSSTSNGTLTFNADGSFVYLPDADFFGSDSFSYRARDAAAESETATVTINVSAVNDAPVAGDDSFEVEGRLTVAAPGVLGNDTDADGVTLTAELVSSTANGVLTFNEDGSFVYTPNEGFSGTDSFTYRASDGELDSDLATVVLSVAGQGNSAPMVDAGPDQVVGLQRIDDLHWSHWKDQRKAEVRIDALFDDLDLADIHTATIDWGDGKVTTGKVLEPTEMADGVVSGKHAYKKAGTYTVTVTVQDGNGGVTSDTLRVTVKKPIEKRNFDAKGDTYKLNEDSVLAVNAAHGVLDNDRGPMGAMAARVVEGPEHGSLVFNADGSFVYTPDHDFHGQDSFWYEFTDGNNVSEAVEVQLNVKDVRDSPRYCVDWGGGWKTPWNDCFMPFGKRWR